MEDDIGNARGDRSQAMQFAGDVAALANNEMIRIVTQDGVSLAVCRVEDEFFAVDDACSHGLASLSEGYLSDDHVLECPFHGGAFDVRTGKPTSFPCTVPIKTYSVQVVDGKIFVGAANS